MLSLIVGARQAFQVIAMKESRGKIVRDMQKVVNGSAEPAYACFLLLHLLQMSEIALPNLRTR